MAIGDAVVFELGAANESHQPSSGVEEKISSIAKQSVTDAVNLKDSAGTQIIIGGGKDTTGDTVNTSTWHGQATSMGIMITNSQYIEKAGTTDRIMGTGVVFNV